MCLSALRQVIKWWLYFPPWYQKDDSDSEWKPTSEDYDVPDGLAE